MPLNDSGRNMIMTMHSIAKIKLIVTYGERNLVSALIVLRRYEWSSLTAFSTECNSVVLTLGGGNAAAPITSAIPSAIARVTGINRTTDLTFDRSVNSP